MNWKKVVIRIGILFVIAVVIFILLYIFNRNVLYDIYDGLKYVKQGLEVKLSREYKVVDKTKTYYKNEMNCIMK